MKMIKILKEKEEKVRDEVIERAAELLRARDVLSVMSRSQAEESAKTGE